MFAQRLLSLLNTCWQGVFAQERTLRRAIEHAVATPCGFGRRTISRTICTLDRHQQDWSADYKLFSRSNWSECRLFMPVFSHYMQRYKDGPVAIGFDDTKTPKCSRKNKSVFRQRDPMSPPFHTNLILAQRFIQASVLFPHYREGEHDCRAVPVRFVDAPAVKKPGKGATEAEKQAAREARRTCNLSTQTLAVMKHVRTDLDTSGGWQRQMVAVLDGSFCNRTIFGASLDRIALLARCRKDAKLCYPAEESGRRKYAEDKFTPEDIRKNDMIPWKEENVFYGGKKRLIRCKEVKGVLWQRGAGLKPLRLIVIAAQPYKKSPHSKVNYRNPAYLLSTDVDSPIEYLVQVYLDRWQIEVNHREEKDILGVGQSQVFSQKSVPRHPAFVVVAYSMMLLASMQEFGLNRTSDFVALPKWRKHARRPSALDLITLLRKEISEMHFSGWFNESFSKNSALYAYT